MNFLKISLVQTILHWEDVDANLAHLTRKIEEIDEPTQVIVLPEMFTTGFTMKPEVVAEEHEGKGFQWMLKLAQQKHCAVTGSISVKHNGNYYNRLYWVNPDGTYQHYDKRHLFRMGNEHQHYTGGTQKLIVDYKGWKICPMICYDLRFPVWSRNDNHELYDVLIYVANWPKVRSYPWEQLLIARAIENQSYVVGVNRIGEDGNAMAHSGNSCILNPRGEIISKPQPDEDSCITAELSYTYLQEFRQQFPVLSDADRFMITGI